jgi:TonB family protein
MYFDFYEDRPDYLALNRDMERLESKLHLMVAVMLAFFLDVVGILLLVVIASMPASNKSANAALVAPKEEPTRFVFMQPMRDMPSQTARPDAPNSDQNRRASSPERAEHPTNPLPFSRGNTPDFIDQPSRTPPQRTARSQPQPEAQSTAPTQPPGQNGQRGQDGSNALVLNGPEGASGMARNGAMGAPGAPGPLAAAVQNPWRYASGDVFNNPGGDGDGRQADIQFDSKGVDFGPWLRRFIAQLKRNWLIPMAAMTMKGHVVVTFNVHRDGRITDVNVVGPCPVQAFNNAAAGALVSSNPTYQLPPDYPADRCFFTVTFYYNETPPYR